MAGLVADERYAEAARDVKLFLEGRRSDLSRSLEERMQRAADEERYEEAASYRDLLKTLEEMEERQKIAAADGDDTDVVAWYAEPPQVAVNVFHLRGGRVVDRRDFFWKDLEEFEPAEFLPSLLKQLYLDAAYLPRFIHTPTDFEDRELLEEVLTEKAGHRVEILNRNAGRSTRFWSWWRKREAFVRTAVPRAEAELSSDRGGVGERVGFAGAAEADRVLRHFAHSGIGPVASMVVGKRENEKKRLTQVHHSRRSDAETRRKLPEICATISRAWKRWSRGGTEDWKRNKPLPRLIQIHGGRQSHARQKRWTSWLQPALASIAKKGSFVRARARGRAGSAQSPLARAAPGADDRGRDA